MKLSLLDWIDDKKPADEDADGTKWPIDLVGQVKRGWPIHPSDAETLFGALATLGFINLGRLSDPASRDAYVFQAVERFQVAHGIEPNGEITRGGSTFLHLNRALDPSRKTSRPVGGPTHAAGVDDESPTRADLIRAWLDGDTPAGITPAVRRTVVTEVAPRARTPTPREVPDPSILRRGRLLDEPRSITLARADVPFHERNRGFTPESRGGGSPRLPPPAGGTHRLAPQAPPMLRSPRHAAPDRGRAQPGRGEPPGNRGGPPGDSGGPPDYCANAPPRPFSREERHSRRALRRVLRGAGHAPPDGWHAHHIIAGEHPAAARARATIADCRIGINDCENGVFLRGPDGEESTEYPSAAEHLRLGNAYYCAVTAALQMARDCAEVRATLRDIRRSLQNGGYP